MNAFWQIMALCRKEFLTLFKDPANRVMLLVPVMIQAMLFGYAANYDLTHVPYAVLDQSHGKAATELIARIDGTGVFDRVASLQSASQIAGMIDREEAIMVISIPADFQQKLNTNEQAPMQVIVDGRNSSTAGSAVSYIANIVNRFNVDTYGNTPAISLDTRAWYNPNLYSRWVIMTALIASLSIMQTLLLAALSVAREREQGTFDQLLVTPLTPMQILIGKAIPSICIGIIQSTLVLLIIRFWFDIPFQGSLWLLYFGLLMFTVAAVGLGLSISALSLTMQQAMLYTFVLIMPLMLLSGLLASIKNMPHFLQIVTYANPLRFGVEIIRRVYLEGAAFSDVAPQFIPLVIMAVLTLPLAAWLFRNRLS